MEWQIHRVKARGGVWGGGWAGARNVLSAWGTWAEGVLELRQGTYCGPYPLIALDLCCCMHGCH